MWPYLPKKMTNVFSTWAEAVEGNTKSNTSNTYFTFNLIVVEGAGVTQTVNWFKAEDR